MLHRPYLGGDDAKIVRAHSNVPPTAGFTWALNAGRSVAFTDTSSDSDGTIVAWAWTFGDGGSSTLQNPTNVYASGGSYTVSLTVTDNLGASSTAFTATVNVWQKDATSLKGVPDVAAGDWVGVLAAVQAITGTSKSAPSRQWLMQEASGTFADTGGASDTLTLGGTGTFVYAQARAGWSRVCAAFAHATSRLLSSATSVSGSTMVLAYIAIDAIPTSTDKTVMFSQGEHKTKITSGFSQFAPGAPAAPTSVTGSNNNATNAFKPVIQCCNATSGAATLVNDAEKLVGTYVATTNKLLFLGAAVNTSPLMACNLAYGWNGAGAEWTLAEQKALCQVLGWTIPWT